MGWNYLSIPKLQRLHRWSLGMDKYFHPTHYNGCDYLSMLGLKLNHVSKRGHRCCMWVCCTVLKYHWIVTIEQNSYLHYAVAFFFSGDVFWLDVYLPVTLSIKHTYQRQGTVSISLQSWIRSSKSYGLARHWYVLSTQWKHFLTTDLHCFYHSISNYYSQIIWLR